MPIGLMAIGAKLHHLYSQYQGGKQIYDWASVHQELHDLESQYESLPDKRKRPGPAIRAAIKAAKSGARNKDMGMFLQGLELLNS